MLLLGIFSIKVGNDLQNETYEKTKLQGRVYELENEIENLKDKYKNQTAVYQNLSKNYKKLRENFTSLSVLENDTISPPYTIIRNKTLLLSFRQFGNINLQINTKDLVKHIVTGRLIRKFKKEDFEKINEKYGIGIDSIIEKFDNHSKYRNLSDIGRYYQVRPFIVTEHLKPISSSIDYHYKGDEEKIRAVWKFVNQTLIKSEDIEENPRLPLETLYLGGGDCEDIIFLTASILKSISDKWEINLVFMDMNNPTNPQKVNHIVLHVDTGEYSTFMEPLYNKEMNPYEQVEGVSIEV